MTKKLMLCRVLQLPKPAKYEKLCAVLRKYFNITEDFAFCALYGDDVSMYCEWLCFPQSVAERYF